MDSSSGAGDRLDDVVESLHVIAEELGDLDCGVATGEVFYVERGVVTALHTGLAEVERALRPVRDAIAPCLAGTDVVDPEDFVALTDAILGLAGDLASADQRRLREHLPVLTDAEARLRGARDAGAALLTGPGRRG